MSRDFKIAKFLIITEPLKGHGQEKNKKGKHTNKGALFPWNYYSFPVPVSSFGSLEIISFPRGSISRERINNSRKWFD